MFQPPSAPKINFPDLSPFPQIGAHFIEIPPKTKYRLFVFGKRQK